MLDSGEILIAYSVAWFVAILLYRRKNPRFTLAYIILLFYAILSVASVIAFKDESAYLVFKRQITIMPLVYLYIMLLISFWPIISLNEKNIQYIEIPSTGFLSCMCVFFSTFSIIYIIDIIPDIQNGLMIMQIDNSDIVELYDDAKEIRQATRTRNAITNLAGVLGNIGAFLNPLLLYTYLLSERKNKIIMTMLILAILQEPLRGIAQANRLFLVTNVLLLAILYFFFKPFLDMKIRSVCKRVGLIVLAVVVIVLGIITVARVVEKNETSILFNVARYMGESPIVFDQYCLNANGTRDGYSTAPFLHLLVGDKVLTEKEIRFKYSSLGVDNSRFYTYVGDFVLDYGPVSTILIIIMLSIIFKSYLIHREGLNYSQILLIFVLVKAYTGYYLFVFNTLAGNLFLLLAFFLCLLFNLKTFKSIRIISKDLYK